MMLGLGASIPVSTVATDAQAAAALALAQAASGIAMPPTMPVGTINSGGFSVLITNPVSGLQPENSDRTTAIAAYGYQLADSVPSPALLTSLGLSPTQTSFNNAQTIAILNAMQGSVAGSSNTSGGLSQQTLLMTLAAGLALLVLVLNMGDNR